jgi:hypothetical protein
MVALLREELADGVSEIASRLRERHWNPVAGILCAAVAATPAIAETVVTGNPFPATGVAAASASELIRRALIGGHHLSALARKFGDVFGQAA